MICMYYEQKLYRHPIGDCSKLQKSGGATAMNAPIIIIKRRRRIK